MKYTLYIGTNKYSLSTEDDILKFPSPCRVSLILICLELNRYKKIIKVGKFPSPYGVSFILMIFDFALKNEFIETFPSPCGVSFILIFYNRCLKYS